MSNDVLRWLIAALVLAHGVGHVLFAPFLAGTFRLTATGHSWLMTGLIGDTATRLLTSIVAIALVVAFAGAAAGVVGQTPWWRPLTLAAAVVSVLLIAVMWDGLPTSSAVFALVFNALAIGALVVAQWPSREAIGS